VTVVEELFLENICLACL